MKAWQAVTVGVLVLAVLVIATALAMPRGYRVERSIEIDAPIAVVFAQVNDLHNHAAWSPWKARDPTMKLTFGKVTVGEGATYSWTSAKSGSGSYEITASAPSRRIETRVDFHGKRLSNGYWNFSEDRAGNVKVTWGATGTAEGTFGGVYAALMDRIVGPAFEQGLVALKKAAENAPRTAAAEEKSAPETTGPGTDPEGTEPPIP